MTKIIFPNENLRADAANTSAHPFVCVNLQSAVFTAVRQLSSSYLTRYKQITVMARAKCEGVTYQYWSSPVCSCPDFTSSQETPSASRIREIGPLRVFSSIVS